MKNLLICSAGRRINIVKYFKEELNKFKNKVFATDRLNTAPALYYADDYFILNDLYFSSKQNFIDHILFKCIELEISHIITLNDVQLAFFSRFKDYFKKHNIELIMSDYNIIKKCYDKTKYNYFPINQVPTTIVKKRYGSASDGLVRQPYIEGQEYNVQCYFDINNGCLIDIFIQKKISMRAGETDKSISCWDQEIADEIFKLSDVKGFRGAIDIDVIKSDKPYIIDINPRFGGGYPLAHYCGCNFVNNIILNIQNKELKNNKNYLYKLDVIMMKYNGLHFMEG